MSEQLESLKPVRGADRPERREIGLRGELILAALPTLVVLAMLGLIDVLSRQRVLFASLASSAFLIYLDPTHGMNAMRTLIGSHLLATTVGLLSYWAFGHGYMAVGTAMGVTIFLLILLDLVHPPAVSTSLIFAFRVDAEKTAVLFLLALGVTATLVVLERVTLWSLGRMTTGRGRGDDAR